MAQRRKLQVFVSSTFTDLKDERQAAVEAILKAGHIPAGMELFTAGDQSQMTVIKEWINESDVYLLLLGARYGSIEPETGKSYTHLEYEYALENNKALFAIVITENRKEEKVKEEGSKVFEQDNVHKYRDFKMLVESNLVGYWNDIKDIKYAVLSTLLDFDKRSELTGWVPGNEVTNSGPIAEEMARLAKENSELREQISKVNASSDTVKYNGLKFDQMYHLLNEETNILKLFDPKISEAYGAIAKVFGDYEASLLHILVIWGKNYLDEQLSSKSQNDFALEINGKLYELGIISKKSRGYEYVHQFTTDGQQFYLRLRLERDVVKAIENFDLIYNEWFKNYSNAQE